MTKKTYLTVLLVAAILAIFASAQGALAKSSSFSHEDAGDIGVFNIGIALGGVIQSFDDTLKKNVLEFDYSLPKNSIIGVWTKDYPPEMTRDLADAVMVGVKASKPEELKKVSVRLEIKGKRAMQKIPLELGDGWNYFRETIDWNAIGDLKEIVFVVSPKAVGPAGSGLLWFNPAADNVANGSGSSEGKLYFNVDFYKLSFLEKNVIFLRLGLIFLISLLGGAIVAFVSMSSLRKQGSSPNIDSRLRGNDRVDLRGNDKIVPGQLRSALKRDFLYGIAAALLAVGAFCIYSIGTMRPLNTCYSFGFLAIGLAGAIIAEFLKFGITGKHITPFEAFQNILLTGIISAASGSLGVLEAPSTWPQIFVLNKVIATIAFLAYHIYNARSLALSGKHIKAAAGAAFIGIPYLFNWLLLLQNTALLDSLASSVSFGLLSAFPAIREIGGRAIVVFGFNEVLMCGIGFLAKGKVLRASKAHFFIFFVSLGVVIAPLIADMGSSQALSQLPAVIRTIIILLTTMFSFAGLWGEVYLITGMALDAGHRREPSWESISKHVMAGMKKGASYSAIVMAIVYALQMIFSAPISKIITANLPIVIGILSGALAFPFVKTIVETFDGSQPFFQRVRHSYGDLSLSARGAIAGYGFAYAIIHNLFQLSMPTRIMFGLSVGLLSSSVISFLRDAVYALKGQGKIQSWKLYFTDGLLGAFVGSAAAFYMDSRQVPVVIEKFKLYTSAYFPEKEYITYPLVNKWGRIDLGTYTGGVKLIFTESLAGVINWAIAAWLFAINKVFMLAFFEKHTAPIKFFFSKAGFAQLIEHMIYVLRWGLWMSPIIFTFLRMMPDPTWYNQDGGIRTIFTIYNSAVMSPETFRTWSLNVFIYVLAFDFFRVLIWMDHMGLRVATLVNLSFIGLDRLDERIARFIGPATAERYIPEAVKRFATWAPLLIPFYLPRGQEWDYAWTTSEAIQNSAGRGGLVSLLQSLTTFEKFLLFALAVFVSAGISFGIRSLRNRSRRRSMKIYELGNRVYRVILKENGEIYSEADHHKADVYPKEYDITRRSYDTIDPSGRILYIVDASEEEQSKKRFWPVIGNFPKEKFEPSIIERGDNSLKVTNSANGIKTTIDINLPDPDSPAELWTITLENMTGEARNLKIVPYLEWVLNGGIHDRFHTQYARLFPEMEYASAMNAILAWHKGTKAMGILASDISPEGFLNSRMDFIGRARSIWKPRILETLDFLGAEDTSPYPTFDPIGSFLVDIKVKPNSSKTARLMVGYAKDREAASLLIDRYIKPLRVAAFPSSKKKKKAILIGHGEIPAGTPKPYFKYLDNGNKLFISTPYTPRPYDHAMSNALGHSLMVTNRGLHTSCNSNSQQNRLTPDWPDTVTKEVPGEAIYLYDYEKHEWYSPTYHPLNEENANNESEFGVDGTAVFRMTKGTISTELTVFVPTDEPTGIYLLTVKNNADYTRHMRVTPYFQMVLEFQPERSGSLQIRRDKARSALFLSNPRNMFHTGWAFVSMSIPASRMETKRAKFFGTGNDVTRPAMVEKGEPDRARTFDEGQIAALLGEIEIPAGEERTVAVILGQAENMKEARRIVQKYKDVETVKKTLKSTRNWWQSLMGTVDIKTSNPEFDWFQNWLKYQALAERIWARRGFYQTSGAYGFRDQLQDAVNLMWVDPRLARKQIILHASHQFLEGDVYHWFFTLSDGRTAFSCRSHASDNPLWLVWAVVEYIKATGDNSILDEMTSYVWSEFPFADLPKNKAGWGHLYHRTTRADSVYRHCLKSIDLVLGKRMGKHGLPLIRTGDWNDGLDEIGSEGKGESVWLAFFLYYIMKDMVNIIEKKDGKGRKEHYLRKIEKLKSAIEDTWRDDRYLRAFHDDGTEIGVKGSGVWEIDALTAAWAVMADINFERGLKGFNTALSILEKDNAVLLGWPALREDTKPYLGRSSKYPEGVRENGMYCHGVQWLIRAARILAERFEKEKNNRKADEYRGIAYRLWLKITPLSHVTAEQIEIYGGQPNKQPADILTNFDQGRMIWNGYTGAAGWLFRQSLEGVIGASLVNNEAVMPADLDKPRGGLKVTSVSRDLTKSPLSVGHP